MTLDLAMRLTEGLLGLAMLQQAAEHMTADRRERLIFGLRIPACLMLVSGLWPGPALWFLLATGLAALHRFEGPYNGGSDRMTLLILVCLSAAHLAPDGPWRELAMAYLAGQLVLSYVISGWVKVINPDWRHGTALADVFRYSAYPVCEDLRGWADRPRILCAAGWAVMLLELGFPLALLHPLALAAALTCTAAFHFSNACFFGLNRFFWIWLSAYPSLLWLQGRVIG